MAMSVWELNDVVRRGEGGVEVGFLFMCDSGGTRFSVLTIINCVSASPAAP
jgi:hypothetical protein